MCCFLKPARIAKQPPQFHKTAFSALSLPLPPPQQQKLQHTQSSVRKDRQTTRRRHAPTDTPLPAHPARGNPPTAQRSTAQHTHTHACSRASTRSRGMTTTTKHDDDDSEPATHRPAARAIPADCWRRSCRSAPGRLASSQNQGQIALLPDSCTKPHRQRVKRFGCGG